MKISLIMATLGRTKTVESFLQSLKKQTYKKFELIIVDQNKHDKLFSFSDKYKKYFDIRHIKSKKGLSHARNIGIQYINGDIIAFPDDDCIYPVDLLYNVNNIFENNKDYDGITGKVIDFEGEMSFGNFDSKKGVITKHNCWTRAVSISIFLKKKVIDKVGKFDTCLGIGSGTPWESGEETDYILRALENNFYIFYNPNISVFHPSKNDSYDEEYYNRIAKYSRGMGRVIKKHNYSFLFLYKYLLRSLGGFFIYMFKFNWPAAKKYLIIFINRIRGWNSL